MPKRFYITTPIYYLNAAPHLGHAYSTIAADVLARYHRLRGHDVHFLTGTDEHGQKIENAAKARGMTASAHADEIAEQYREVWRKLGISHDDFIRTTEARHQERVHELWRRVRDRGDIYLGDYEGWYCVADEAFYTEKELVNGMSPTGRPVERIKEPSYFFRLSKYEKVLLDFYERHPEFVQPEGRFNEVKAFVRSGLTDLSISRTTFTWGVPVPDDPRHVIYVWFDALTNYWSALGPESAPLHRFWPPQVHLVGKEIIRFHAVYWPAFLLAAGFTEEQLPACIYAHGWLTVNGAKMSKSDGNFLDPVQQAEAVGNDALRYYLLRAIAFGQDGDFDQEDLLKRVNTELGNDLGNLLNRTLGLCAKSTSGRVPAYGEETALEVELRQAAAQAADEAARELEALAPHRALEAVWALCRKANTYVDHAAPWKAQKAGDDARVGTILATLLEVCGHLSSLLTPFLPTKAAEMREQLSLSPITTAVDVDHWPSAWAPRPAGAQLGKAVPLFPRIDDDVKAKILEQIRPKPVAPKAADAVQPDAQKAAPAAEAAAPSIGYEEFAKVDLRVGKVLSAERVPKKDKLLDLRVDVGEAEPRRIVAGLALSFKPEQLVGRSVVVVANLAPRDFGKGLVSHGMLLAAGPSEALSLVDPGDKAAPGTKVK